MCSVTIVPTCSINDNEINDTVANLNSGNYETLNTAPEAQRQLAIAGRAVHAFVGPPCMTGLIVNSGLSTAQNIPVVSYYSVAFQVETSLNSTFATLSSVSTMNSQQGKDWGWVSERNHTCTANALGIILSTYKWTQFAILSDDFLLNTYLSNAIQYYVANGLLGELRG
jgi:hypothetical protein